MGWTDHTISRPPFVGDWNKAILMPVGRQIDWANVPTSYIPAGDTKKQIPAGTVMCATEGGDGEVIPYVDALGAETALCLLATNAREDAPQDAHGNYGMLIGGPVWDNLLPEATGTPAVIAAQAKSEMATAGCTFFYMQYSDNTTS